jgi:transcriptional regulator with XRE-family HTH domain
MGHKRRFQPKYLPAKLLAIRKALGKSQTEMVKVLEFKVTSARISEYEHGRREPNLIVLLTYARAAKVRVELLIDDSLSLPDRFQVS